MTTDNTTKKRKNARVLLRDVRISFPHLDAPTENALNPSAPPKYSAAFVFEPGSDAHKTAAAAIAAVADATWDAKYAQRLRDPMAEKQPLHRGDDRQKVYDGYAGMMYLSASNREQPELRDADPRIKITDAREIRQKFLPGYRVNAVVEFWPETRYSQRVCAQLVGVQFAGYADVFGGAAVEPCDFPDVSEQAAASQVYDGTISEEDVPF